MRKFLKKETEFFGYVKTALLVLKDKPQGLKVKKLAKQISNCFRLSEDFDSDSDASDDDNKLYRKGTKSVIKLLKKDDRIVIDNDIAKIS